MSVQEQRETGIISNSLIFLTNWDFIYATHYIIMRCIHIPFEQGASCFALEIIPFAWG